MWIQENLWWIWAVPMMVGLLWALFSGHGSTGRLPAPPLMLDTDARNALIHLDMASESIRAAKGYLTGRASLRDSHACSEIRIAKHRLSSAIIALNGDEIVSHRERKRETTSA